VSGQRKALIIANDEYDQEALQDLLAPAADAEALGRVLGDRQIGEFTVQVVRNEPAHVIQAHIEELFSESRPDDVLLVHFSGHGLKSESGELFFAASNTRPNRLGSTAVSADFVQRCMRASRSRSVVLLLDCCYGGAFAQGVKVRAAGDVNVLDSFPQERTGGGRGRAVITASSAMEYAFEGDQLADDHRRRASVFTSALVEGLATGAADRDEDGWVSLNELYDYVYDKVREQNPHQTPSRQVELEGELYLARSRRRRIRPAPIPADLQAAIVDPNMYTRLGAVSELQSRLTSDNLPTAAGAYEALAELARTDIGYVAEPAAEALRQAALHPEETALHFGEQRQGSAPPHRTFRLLGPPIARACAPRASDDWIRVDETAEGFDVSIDTANAGILRGTLDLKGVTGEAVIAIDSEILPPTPQTPLPPRNEPTDGASQPEGRSAVQARQKAQEASQTSPASLASASPAAAQSGTAEQAAAPPEAGDRGEQIHAPPARPEDAQRRNGKERALAAHPKAPAQPSVSRAQAPVAQPKLELSTLAVDFGHIRVGSKPKPRRVTVLRGGNLNVRVTSAPAWIETQLTGGTLMLKAEPKVPGSLLGDVLIDSDGGSATIRVTVTVDSPNVPPSRRSPSVPLELGYYQGDKLATWWQRALAAVIDLVAYIPGITLWGVGGGIYSSGLLSIGVVVTVATWVYNRCYLQGRTGQSWGKRVTGLKLIRMSDKESVGSSKAAARDLAHILDVPTLYLLPIWGARRQTLADKTTRTVVISLKG
jgi:Caspase domain/RDD family